MRFYYFLLVVTATLLASANASLGVLTNSNLAIVPDFHVTETYAAGNDNAASKRFLRTKTTTTEKEERGQLTTNVLTKLQTLFKTGAASKVSKQAGTVVTMLTPRRKLTQEMLAKQQKYLDGAFTTLKVKDVKGNIFTSPELQKWVTRRQKFNKMHHIEDESGFQIISKYFKDDQQLSDWIDIARRDEKLKDMVDQFRAGQLSQLFSVGTHPDKIYILLNVKKLSKFGQVSDNRALYRKYLTAYSKYWVGKTPPSLF